MKNNKPQDLIADGISLMQKGRLTSASAIFWTAAYAEEDASCAELLDAICDILAANGTHQNEVKKSRLESAIEKTDKALANLRNELDRIEQSGDADADCNRPSHRLWSKRY